MIYLIGVGVLIALDQLSKYAAVQHVMGNGTQTFIPGVLGFRYTENTGAAFSIFKDKQLFLIVITSIVIAALVGYMLKAIRTDAHLAVRCAYVLLIAGALGNLIDRIRLDYVVDFLEFQFVHFPIFNLADVCVVVGVGLLVVASLFLGYEF